MKELPIDVVPGTSPPRFRWRQVVDTPIGRAVQEHEGLLPLSVEQAVEELVAAYKHCRLALDTAMERVAAQSELLGRSAEKTKSTAPSALPSSSSRRGRG